MIRAGKEPKGKHAIDTTIAAGLAELSPPPAPQQLPDIWKLA
jgi:hypothetical protein